MGMESYAYHVENAVGKGTSKAIIEGVVIVTLIQEIDQIVALLEAQIPASQSDPRNRRLERRLQRVIADYFKALTDAFPYHSISDLYYRHMRESIEREAGDILDPILANFDGIFASQVNGHLLQIYLQGSSQMITWGKTKGGVPIAYEGPPVQEAIDWAEKNAAKLVTRMADETKSQLAKVVSDGIKNKRGIDGLSRDIRKQFDNMTRYRSRVIARTETANALGESFINRGKEMGIEGKEWITMGDDRVSDICLGNEAIGVIPFNQPFPSGHMTVPGHVQCRCTCAPARLPE